MRIGIEVGGTFTDLVAMHGERFSLCKVPSVRGRPDEGALAALDAAQVDLAAVSEIVHGSTVATNAVLERKGGRIGFVTTAGFEDILFLQRHDRRRIYDLFYSKPAPVVRRRDCLGLRERILSSGIVETALDDAEAEAELGTFLLPGRFDAVAVCLLNAYANPRHEHAVREIMARVAPDLPVAVSSDVSGVYREYERATTVTVSAYVQPVVGSYLKRLEGALRERGFTGRFSVMQSNGGSAPAGAVAANAINALLSGPAAGVMGALRQVQRAGFSSIMTLDIGGTSADVCLVTDGAPALAPESRIDGLPIQAPMLDINTVGAGGGSIVGVDEGGVLRVGPESAGADPGPACYGRGGDCGTLTDAHVVRGTIRASARLGGSLTLDVAAAHAALAEPARRLGKPVRELAENAIRVANANISAALRIISTERGRDPRDYALVPFGGAGPLHAAEIAEDLGIRSVVVPPGAGVISAYGLLVSETVHFETLTRNIPVNAAAPEAVRDVSRELRRRCIDYFARLGVPGRVRFGLQLDMRMIGQAYELAVPFAEAEMHDVTESDLLAKFGVAHEDAYSFAVRDWKSVEIVSFRLRASVEKTGAEPPIRQVEDAAALDDVLPVVFRGRTVEARFIHRSRLQVEGGVEGPAVIEDSTSTTFVPPDWHVTVDSVDNLVLRMVRDED